MPVIKPGPIPRPPPPSHPHPPAPSGNLVDLFHVAPLNLVRELPLWSTLDTPLCSLCVGTANQRSDVTDRAITPPTSPPPFSWICAVGNGTLWLRVANTTSRTIVTNAHGHFRLLSTALHAASTFSSTACTETEAGKTNCSPFQTYLFSKWGWGWGGVGRLISTGKTSARHNNRDRSRLW